MGNHWRGPGHLQTFKITIECACVYRYKLICVCIMKFNLNTVTSYVLLWKEFMSHLSGPNSKLEVEMWQVIGHNGLPLGYNELHFMTSICAVFLWLICLEGIAPIFWIECSRRFGHVISPYAHVISLCAHVISLCAHMFCSGMRTLTACKRDYLKRCTWLYSRS